MNRGFPSAGIIRQIPQGKRLARRSRVGQVLVVTVVCLALVGMMTASLVQSSLSYHRQLRAASRKLQADWLAQSALERAAARLHQSADYQGETWKIDAVQLAGSSAVVEIQVLPDGDDSRRRRIRARADYPDDPLRRVRSTKEASIELPGDSS